MNQNLSKLSKLIDSVVIDWFSLILASHSPTSGIPSLMIPSIGVSIAERLRDRAYDCCIRFDDPSKHSKSYRQISSIPAKIPSRDAFPADTSNIHSSLSERSGKLNYNYFGGSITMHEFSFHYLFQFSISNSLSFIDLTVRLQEFY